MRETEDASSQIGEIIEVLDTMAKTGGPDLAVARQRAQASVALERGIRTSSVRDKCTRKLGISSVRFDELVSSWLHEQDTKLQSLMESRTASRPRTIDLEIIRSFFAQGRLTSTDAEAMDEDLNARAVEGTFDQEAAEEEIDERIKAGNYEVPDRWGKRKVRKGQRIWRRMVLANFRGQCAVCGLNTTALLEAAHIRSWAKAPADRLNPLNGYAFCRDHHRAFDRKILRINDGVIAVDQRRYDPENGAARALFSAFDGKPLIGTPARPVLKPT